MMSTGRCHSRSTTEGPQSCSNSLAKRGPTPFSAVTGAKSGLSEAGRKEYGWMAAPGALNLELQKTPALPLKIFSLSAAESVSSSNTHLVPGGFETKG